MCPIYLIVAWPLLRTRNLRSILWFAHPSVTPTLRLADRLADTILTSLPGAYPLPGEKVRVIGQAVDLDAFPFSPRRREDALHLVALGRTSPSKGFPLIVRGVAAARDAGVNARLRIIGPSTTAEEVRHRRDLERLVEECLGDAGEMSPGLTHDLVPAALLEADALLNAMVSGSGDKVVFEAAAVGRPVIVSNPSFSGLLDDLALPPRFPPGDVAALAGCITALATADDDSRLAVAKELRVRIEREHSMDHWAVAVRTAIEDPS
jgi:glycosyltransferase involved in cell wall biosynthesis